MVIEFNKNFYKLKAIKKATRAYKNLADFEIKEEKNRIRVKISNSDKEIKDVLGDEFCNFALAEMKNENV